MKDRILLILINIIAVFCSTIFILARLESLPAILSDQELIKSEKRGEFGDLYFMNRLDYFKTKLPDFEVSFNQSENNSPINEADILIFGDSYFASSRVLNNFPKMISDTFNVKVHSESETYPLTSISKNKYLGGKKKYLIYEATERRILEDFKNIHQSSSDERIIVRNLMSSIFPYNIESNYLYILQRSIISSKLYSFVMNFKFNTLGLISDITPIYSLDPPFLFYYQNVNSKNTSFYYRFTEEEMRRTADNIEELKKKLIEEYNLEMIFMPLPSSYTINHKIINNDSYNNLLPKLYQELNKRNVQYVNLYNKYIQSDKLLYYSTDTHWNEEGMRIAFNELKNILINELK